MICFRGWGEKYLGEYDKYFIFVKTCTIFPLECFQTFSILFTFEFISWWCEYHFHFWLSPIKTVILKVALNFNDFSFFYRVAFHAIESGRSTWPFGNSLSRNASTFFSLYRGTWWFTDSPLLFRETRIRAHCYRNCKGKIKKTETAKFEQMTKDLRF